MDEGYAAQRAGNVPLFHALLVVDQIGRLPERFARDLDYIRLMLDLSDDEFDRAIELCERHSWIHWMDNGAPEPQH